MAPAITKSISLLLMMACCGNLAAQTTRITGTVTDSETGEPLPFVNIILVGSSVGTTSNPDGTFRIETNTRADSIKVSFIGYLSQSRKITPGISQVINFSLDKELVNLDEITFVAEENPAWGIMRNVVANKKRNDRRTLPNYEHDTYTKIEFDVAQMAEKFQKKKLVQKVYQRLDSIGDYRDQNGQPSVPVFHSESISKLYIQHRPYLQKEEIQKANINGVGIRDKKQVSQLTGVSFQQYNFYENWMTIINKEFVSPLADGWKTYYEYYVVDSANLDGELSYRLDFYPKNERDLAFKGHMWITSQGYALKKIDAVIGSQANLNFIESLELYQELDKTSAGPWVPVKTRFAIKISELAPNLTGVTAKFLITASNITLGHDYPESFFILPVELSPDVVVDDPAFWEANRPEPLNEDDIKALNGINAVRKIAAVNAIADAIKMIRRGYVRTEKVDFGPWLYSYANNDIERHRFRFGLRTNSFFSEKIVLSGYGAYGTKDDRFKYGARIDLILSRKPWTALTLEHRFDLEQLGALDEALRKNFIFNASQRFGDMASPHLLTQNNITFQRDLLKGLTAMVSIKQQKFEPLFPFAFYKNFSEPNQEVMTGFETTEVTVEARLSRGEIFIYENNLRFSLGKSKKPVITLRYTKGFDGILKGDFNYHKFSLRVNQNINFGLLGTGVYTTELGYIPTTLPFPLLKNHFGSNSFFYNPEAFNLMDKGEFVSDKYVFLKYNHFFQGYILNRLPVMRKLKWRVVASFTFLYGELDQSNRDGIPMVDPLGQLTPVLQSVEDKPYMEFGYGVENILRMLRVQAFHRLSYLDLPDARSFGIKLLFTVKP